MTRLTKVFTFAALLVLAVFSYGAEDVKAQSELTPEEVVEKVTDELLSFVKANAGILDEDSEEYFFGVKRVLDPAVDFESISKSVMGKRYWLEASEEQRKEFVTVFTSSLVRTYGKGMANFTDLDITVESSRPSDKNPKVYYVQQTVKTQSGGNKILYTMRKDEYGWRVRNVILNGINLGKTSQSQFSEAVKANKGDVGVAISNWGKTI